MIAQKKLETASEVNAILKAMKVAPGRLPKARLASARHRTPDCGLSYLGVDADYTEAWSEAMEDLIGDRAIEDVPP